MAEIIYYELIYYPFVYFVEYPIMGTMMTIETLLPHSVFEALLYCTVYPIEVAIVILVNVGSFIAQLPIFLIDLAYRTLSGTHH